MNDSPPPAAHLGQGPPEDEEIERAKGYPYRIPDFSYVFTASGETPLDGFLLKRGLDLSELLSGRTAVAACGSNASPEQLKRKCLNYGLSGEIPVIQAVLRDFDAVYSANFTSYGSLPATLAPSEGVRVNLFVTFLDEAQLGAMNVSEAEGVNYDLVPLDARLLTLEAGRASGGVRAHRSRHEGMRIGGGCVALSEIAAEGRKFPEMTQAQVQECVRDLLDKKKPLDDFIRENIRDPDIRKDRNRRLKESAAISFA
ncbi:MAG: hypothetical protein VCE91_13865 [Nitrospinota bacterium]